MAFEMGPSSPFFSRQPVSLQPENLLVDPWTGWLKLGDFGSVSDTTKHPQAPDQVTLYYRPPEVCAGSVDYSTPVDVWGAGLVLYELYRVCSQTLPPTPSPGRWTVIVRGRGEDGSPHLKYTQ